MSWYSFYAQQQQYYAGYQWQQHQQNEMRHNNLMNDFEKFGRGLAEAGKQCAQKEIEMYKCLEKRNEMLEPVYENFWENLRKVQNYHSAALHHLLVYKHNYERFECCLNNIWFFEKHSFVCAAQIKNMFASHNVEERRTNHGEVVVRMETLLFETDRAIKNIIDSWEDEKKQHDPSKADGYEGSVIIEEIDDKVLEKKSDIIEVADEIGELKNEFAKMSTQIDEIREMVRNVCQLIQVQTENCDQKRGNYRNRSVEATALEPARSEERSKKSYDCDDTKSSNVLVELTCEDCSCPQAEPRFERESYEYSRGSSNFTQKSNQSRMRHRHSEDSEHFHQSHSNQGSSTVCDHQNQRNPGRSKHVEASKSRDTDEHNVEGTNLCYRCGLHDHVQLKCMENLCSKCGH